MTTFCLILTNPYAYDKALQQALHRLQSSGDRLKAAFLIDPSSLDDLVRDLGEQGWLGLSSRRSLQASMLEGYRAVAADVLQEVQRAGAAVGITVETSVEEVPLAEYLQNLLGQDHWELMVSVSQDTDARLMEIMPQIEWVRE